MTDKPVKYIACSFQPGGRTYTYHADFPVKIGDMVTVESRNGLVPVRIEEISDEKPKFPTKPAQKIQEEGPK